MLQEEIVKGRHLTPAPPLALQQKPGWERRHSAKFIGQGPKVFFGLKKTTNQRSLVHHALNALVAGAWTERKKMFHGGSFLKLADDNMDIQNPEAQNRELSGF